MEDLPDEVLLLIFSHLCDDMAAVCQAACVCRRWGELTKENVLWEHAVEAIPCKNLRPYRKKTGGLRRLVIEEAQKRRTARERHELKLVVVGDSGVGKTSTIVSYTTAVFPHEYTPTVADQGIVNMTIDALQVSLMIWDTAGAQDYDRLRPLGYLYPPTDVFLVCFSLVDPSSLENVCMKWVPEISHYCPNTPFILGGAKLDLLTSVVDTAERKAHMTVKEGKRVARKTRAASFVAYSALTQQNLMLLFDECTRVALQSRIASSTPKKPTSSKCVLH